MLRKLLLLAALLLAGSIPAAAQANAASSASPLAGVGLQPGADGTLSLPMQIAIGLTLLTLLPAVIMSITPFLRSIIVLHFLRQALGTQSTPSNPILLGLALFISLLVMQPVTSEIYANAWQPLEAGQITTQEALDVGAKPLKSFLVKFVRESDVKLFLDVTGSPEPATPDDLSLSVLIPSYILSELKAGFQIGAVLYLPFVIIDLVVASVTLSIGMIQLPPVMLSAPFKILLFVLVDGWSLVVGSLMKSFYP
jgi:flagellar biosynthesis protein FliP